MSNTRSNDLYAWLGHGSGTTSSTPNGLNQITSHGGATLTWDARGNLSNDGATSYAHTAENLLITAGSAGFAYDPLGRLSGSGYTNFGFDYAGGALSSEFVYTNGQLLRRYVHGPGVDEPLVWYEGTGTSDRRFLHADERGSIVAVTNSAGSVMGLNLYDEYGRPSVNNIGRFQYTGQTYMGEAGLYYYKARWYDPRVPVFLQSDPIGYGSGMNLYAYVGNDPVNFTDPSGMKGQGPNPYVTRDDPKYDDQLIIVEGRRPRECNACDTSPPAQTLDTSLLTAPGHGPGGDNGGEDRLPGLRELLEELTDPESGARHCPVRPPAAVTSAFGARRSAPPGYHTGVDLRARLGAPIYATQDGRVTFAGRLSRGGNSVVIRNDDRSISGHAHTSPLDGISRGVDVSAGQRIGTSDGSGTSAAHLHYRYSPPGSTERVDPIRNQIGAACGVRTR